MKKIILYTIVIIQLSVNAQFVGTTYIITIDNRPVFSIIAGIILNEKYRNQGYGMSIYKNILEQAEKKVETGDKISQVFAENESFYPSFVGEMIAVGEETGELSEMLMKVGEFLRRFFD